MVERIDKLKYQDAELSSTVEGRENVLYLTGPAEFLCAEVAAALLNDSVWSSLFGENIDHYKRMDYAIRNLPAIRIYNNSFRKDYESWFLNGDLVCDIIFPANLRRPELQQIPDTLCAAIIQQFRRPTFFENLAEIIPGLNELGKTVDVDKSLAFEWGEELVPLTQITLNFRIDLREWDRYLESDYRTKDDPFSRPLGDLREIATIIQAIRDDNEVELEVNIDQNLT